MSPIDELPDESFVPAAAGTRVRAMTALVLAVFVIVMAINAVALSREPTADYWLGVAAPLAGVPIVAAVWWTARVLELRLQGADLVVVRRLFPVRFPLAGFVSAEPNRNPLAGARRVRGNDGLGAVSGKFRSAALGEFRAHLTDREYGVVLRTAAGTLVVSPSQPTIFIDAVKRRVAKLEQAEGGGRDS